MSHIHKKSVKYGRTDGQQIQNRDTDVQDGVFLCLSNKKKTKASETRQSGGTDWMGWGPPLGKCFNYTTPKQNCNLYSKHSKGTKLKILFSVFVSFFFGALLKLTFCVKVITSVLLRFQFFEETKPLFPAAITSHTKSSVGNVNRNKYRKVWQY